jgi:hypothetical protein
MATWLGSPTSVNQVPILLSGTTITSISSWNGDGTTYSNFFTSPTLPAGTYYVGVDFYAYPNGTAWNAGDSIACRIVANSDTATTFIYPTSFTRPFYTGFATSAPYSSGTGSATCAGVVILRTDGVIYYQGTIYNTTGANTHSIYMEQATYQKIA